MSIEAMAWALGVKVGNPGRKLVLWGLANHAHKDGRYAWCSTETLAEYAECSERHASRHVARLLEDGFIREGDQSAVAHIDPRHRPIVYDLAMTEARMRRWRASQTQGLRNAAAAAGAQGGKAGASKRWADKMSPLRLVDNDPREPVDNAHQDRDETDIHRGARGDTRGDSRGDTRVTQTVEPLPYGERTKAIFNLLCRRLSLGELSTATDDDIRMWQELAGPRVDLHAEALAFLVHNANVELRNGPAAWAGWLRKPRHRSPLGCERCTEGWLGFDRDERPIPCPVCRPPRRPRADIDGRTGA